jgi:hypothetical protein
MRRLNLLIIMALSALAAAPTFAARTMAAPRFSWHDWYYTQAWCDPSSPNAEYKNIEVSVSNVSNATQTVTMSCTPIDIGSGSAGNPGVQLTPRVSIDGGGGESSPTTTVSTTFTLAAYQSYTLTCHAIYRGAPGGAAGGGDWHLTGSFDIKFTVNEDRGAITAVMLSQMESSGCALFQKFNFDNPSARTPAQVTADKGLINAMVISNMRNASRTITVNGGRPF